MDSERRSTAQTRSDLAQAGRAIFVQLSAEVLDAITSAAPSASAGSPVRGGWQLELGSAKLNVVQPEDLVTNDWGGWDPPAFDVVLSTEINLRVPPNPSEYEGRSHSLWYCDAERDGEYAWYETAFMISAMIARRGRQNPFALPPGEESAKALWSGIAEFQIAWPFTRLTIRDMGDFIDRWAGWLGAASQGHLAYPSRMPERDGCQDSFRRS